MKYQHRQNGRVAQLIEKNDKAKQVTLQFEDNGEYKSFLFSTFKRYWKKLDEGDEALEQAVVEPDSVAGDGTPLAEVGKEIAEQAKQKAEAVKKVTADKQVKKKAREKVDITPFYNKVSDVLTKAGYYIKRYEKEPKIIPISQEVDVKKAFGNICLGSKKCVLCIKLAEVPEGYTPDRVRNCPLGAAFDIEYDNLGKIVEILKSRKIVKKEEK